MDPKEAQKARAAKYGIAVKPGGHVTKPGQYSSLGDEEFADPVNYRYPIDAAHIHAALSYWAMPKNREEYSADEQKKIGARIDAAAKNHKVQLAGKVQAAGDMSFGDIRQSVCDAICAAETGFDCYIVDIFPDSVIYRSCGQDGTEKLYRRSYSIVDNTVTLGDPAEVERDVSYVPMTAASRILSAAGNPGSDDYGYVWRVQVNEYGLGKDGRINWTKDPLVAAIPTLIEGARVFALNESQHQASSKPFGKSVKEIIGWLKNVCDTGTALEADLYILKSAQWLRDGLVDSFERGKPDLFGLSFDATGSTASKMIAGKKVIEPIELKAVEVDVVYDPTNNGKFIRMAAAIEAAQKGDTEMFKKLMAALQEKQPELYARIQAGMTAGTMTEDEALEQIAAAATKETDRGTELIAAMKELVGTSVGQGNEVKLLACSLNLDKALLVAKLPEKMEAHVHKMFAGKIFEDKDLQEEIKAAKELCDDLTGSGNVTGMGGARVVCEPTEKLQAACDQLFDLKPADNVKDVKPFRSLRAAYVEITGDTDVRGYIDDQAQLRQLKAAGFDSSTFQFVLGNTLYRRMITDYNEIGDFGTSLLVGQNIRNARDFRSLQSVRIAYFGDLPNVDPENDEDYADLGNLSDEKIDYTLGQKGGIITISRKMIINDDIRAVDTIRRRLPRAARRTLAKTVWNLLLNNTVYMGDNKAVFHVDHNNLDTTAFGQTPVQSMKTRLYRQTEPQSLQLLALKLKTLAIPEDLWGAAVSLNQTQNFLVSQTQVGNPFYHYFGPNNENIFECPFMVDTTDYIGLADTAECEIVELAFLNGQQEPEMFVADNPNFGQFFVGDRIQYKVRHEYNAALTDYRGVQRNIVVG